MDEELAQLPPAYSESPFELPTLERRPSGWFLEDTNRQLEVKWFDRVHSALYVREEYRDLLESILEWAFRVPVANDQADPPERPPSRRLEASGGHWEPGIGKSAFVRYILVLRCMMGLPTVFMEDKLWLNVYHQRKQLKYSLAARHIGEIIHKLPVNTWILVDSSSELVGVPLQVTQAKCFVLQAMSPRQECTRWLNKTTPRPVAVVMKPWTADELIAARPAQKLVEPVSDSQLREFVRLYGGSARDAYAFASAPDHYRRSIAAAIPTFTAKNLNITFGPGPIPNFPVNGIPHMILSVFPQTKEDLRGFIVAPPTSHVRDLLMTHIEGLDQTARNELFSALRGYWEARSLARSVLEVSYHRVLLENGRVWPLHAAECVLVRRNTRLSSFHVRRKTLGGDPPARRRWRDDLPVAWLSLQDELTIHDDGPEPLQDGRVQMRVVEFQGSEFVPPLSPQTYYRSDQKVSSTLGSFVITEPRKAVVFQPTVGPGGTDDNDLRLGFESLKVLGIDEVVFTLVAPVEEVDFVFPPGLDAKKHPRIIAYYFLNIQSI
ncbi:hypothetical protein B0H19DRAFT_1386117 [Mycena capillaripes]|nr:hypothetical protein B0H19DRAFT_1386117 [Mycena capillaripes]